MKSPLYTRGPYIIERDRDGRYCLFYIIGDSELFVHHFSRMDLAISAIDEAYERKEK